MTLTLRLPSLSSLAPTLRCATAIALTLTLALTLALALGACGSSTGTLVCEPACPAGTRCTQSGCLPDGIDDPDLAIGADLAGCTPACSGNTPHCGPGRTCVPCLLDSHCPIGQVCKQSGNGYLCLPGCTDDSRCGAAPSRCCGGACLDTSKDIRNCGNCGTVCGGQHSSAKCVGGQCMAGTCDRGWGDCNGNGADGCETNLRADPKNCTSCGMVCSIPGAIAGCSSVETPPCYIAACNFGFDDCNGVAKDGCETAVSSDTRNCGMCGLVCPLVQHATSACVVGACALKSCDPGYADCDGSPKTGCEIATATDKNNCGRCGNACGAQQVCINGLCTCPPCNFPNALSACVNNMCALGQCNAGFDNCDGNAQNGCELATSADVKNCGGCGVVCAQGLICSKGSCTCQQCNFPNAQSSCVNNVCVLTACLPGFANCDKNPANGCEVTLSSDGANCGACGLVCPMGQTCQLGMCSATIHNTVAFAPAKTAANTCAFNNSGAIPYVDLGQMTWKACMVEASKRAAMLAATQYTNPSGWYAHRNGANAMTGVWNVYRAQLIGTPFACVLGRDPNGVFDPNRVLANTITYDAQVWHYQDFGVKFYDECQTLATQYGSSIITPWTIGLNADNYFVQSVHQCNTYEWITNQGTAIANDNVGVNARSTQHLCMVGYVDN